MSFVRSVIALVLLLPATTAAAQQAYVFPPERAGGDPVDEDLRARAVGAVEDALRSGGVQVVRGDGRLGPEERACERPACAPEVLAALDADFAVMLGFWAPTRSRGLQVVAMIVDPAGAVFQGEAVAEGDAVEAAAVEALEHARSRQALGTGPWISIRGTPLGARYRLDGGEEGITPARVRVQPGLHHVVVEMDGYGSFERTVRVPEGASAEEVVEYRLATVDSSTPPSGGTGPREDRGGGIGWVGPALLGAAGLGAMGVAGYGLVAGEEVTVDDDGRPVVRGPSPTGIAVWGLVGALLVTGAAVWLWSILDEPEENGGTAGAAGTEVRRTWW